MAYTPTDWECGQTVAAEKLNNIERGVAEVNSEYTPTTWQCGDVITAEKMNKIEQGIANADSNPNTVQTVTGTLANPFGSVDVANLGSALASMNATAYFEADASVLGAGTVSARLGGNATMIWGNGANFDALGSSVTAFGLDWDSNGDLTFAKMLSNGNVVDISTYASNIPTTTTIVWHPLP